jgi:type IV pilus assembly protein PilY1
MTTPYFLGLKDAPAVRATPYSLSDLVPLQARFVTASVNGVSRTVRTIGGTNAGAGPWALTLFSGQSGWGGPATVSGSERVFTKPLVVGSIVFFTSFIPDSDPCSGIGETWVYALDFKTGLPPTKPVFDLNGDGKFTDADKVVVNGSPVVPVGVRVGRGLGSHPVLFKDTLFVTTSMTEPVANNPGGESVTGLNAIKVNIPQAKVRLESWKHN